MPSQSANSSPGKPAAESTSDPFVDLFTGLNYWHGSESLPDALDGSPQEGSNPRMMRRASEAVVQAAGFQRYVNISFEKLCSVMHVARAYLCFRGSHLLPVVIEPVFHPYPRHPFVTFYPHDVYEESWLHTSLFFGPVAIYSAARAKHCKPSPQTQSDAAKNTKIPGSMSLFRNDLQRSNPCGCNFDHDVHLAPVNETHQAFVLSHCR